MTINKQTGNFPDTGHLGKLLLVVLLAWMLYNPGVLASAADKPVPKRILFIFAFKQALPWAYRVEEGMRAALASEFPFPIELNVEHADRPRYPEQTYLEKVVDLYRYKYAGQKIDLVLTMGDELAELLIKHMKELFGDISVVLVAAETEILPPDQMNPNVISLKWGWDFGRTIELIKELLPQTKHLFIISGNSTTDLAIRKMALNVMHKYEDQFNIQLITDFVTSEMLKKVAHLPKDSAIFYLTLFRDINDDYFVPRDIMYVLSQEANAPTFGMGDTLLGHGIVGGNLLSAEDQGKRLAKIAVKILNAESVKDRKTLGTIKRLMFDWRQLKRWSIDEKRLPPGSIVKFKELNFWDSYKGQIIGVSVIILAQAFALILLLVQRKKRTRAEEESQRLRDEIAHISRVLAMGEIAASLAHELNQPLTAIQSYAQAAQRFLARDRPDLDEAGKSLAGIVAGNRRAKEVIERIRMALKKEPFDRVSLNVQELIEETIALMKRAAAEKKVVLKLDLAPGLPKVFGDYIQLQQVILNLIINGLEVMGDVGDNSRELVLQASEDESGSVIISVQDSGIGFDEEKSDLLFNPFFSTKETGMGMGLSISRSIIENHGGQLWATQNPHKGATFSFTVPIYKEN